MPISPVPYQRFSPEYSPSAYSPRDALSFALASQLAYAQTPSGRIARTKLENTLGSWGFEDVEPFDIRRGKSVDTQGYLARNGSHLLVAFRGTDSNEDWRANIQATKDAGPFPKSEVHEGFQDAFFPAVLEIGRTLERFRVLEQDVWITGHSLGGALAVLLVATLLENGLPVKGLYTFGAPRVGDKRFERAFNDALRGASFRVVNQDDVVPHLPPEPFFSHTGNRILFLNDGTRSTKTSDWTKLRSMMWGWLGGFVGQHRVLIKEPHQLASDVGYLRRLLDDLDGSGE